ncbi:MAG: hypothetical protein ACOH1N_04955 [Lutibacter sp.]
MKKIIFALAFMLVGTFAFANNSVEAELNVEETVEVSNILELISNDVKSIESYTTSTSYSDALGCLLKFTFVLEDGSTVVKYYYTSQSCAEFFESIE